MKSVNISDARNCLSGLVKRAEGGEEIVITKSGRPVARLVPINCALNTVKVGGLELPHEIPDNFDTMFQSEIETLFSSKSRT